MVHEGGRPRVGPLQSGDVAKQGGLAAAAVAHDHHERAGLHAEVDPVQGLHAAPARAVTLAHPRDPDLDHGRGSWARCNLRPAQAAVRDNTASNR